MTITVRISNTHRTTNKTIPDSFLLCSVSLGITVAPVSRNDTALRDDSFHRIPDPLHRRKGSVSDSYPPGTTPQSSIHFRPFQFSRHT